MNEEIKRIGEEIYRLFLIKYELLLPVVDNIIISNIRNENYIEHILDEVMDIQTKEGKELFFALVDYYSAISPENAKSYIDIFNEYYKDDTTQLKV